MSTTIRPELSKKNKYWIDRHRYYELKHFCLQYPLWRKAYVTLDGFVRTSNVSKEHVSGSVSSDPTAKNAERKIFYSERMDMVKRAANAASEELSDYIFKAVTEGLSYDTLKTKFNIPCCKDTYYAVYRKFFWLLDKERG